MEEINSLCNAMGLEEVTLQEASDYLFAIHDPSDPELFSGQNAEEMDSSTIHKVISITKILFELNDVRPCIDSLKKITASILSHFYASETIQGVFLSTRALFRLFSLPSASAYGLVNTNMISCIISKINKHISIELKSTGSANGASKKNSNNSKGMKNSNYSKQKEDEDDIDDNNDQDEDDMLIEMPSKNINRKIVRAKHPSKADSLEAILNDFVYDLSNHSLVVLVNNNNNFDESEDDQGTLNILSDMVCGIMYLCSNKNEYSKLMNAASELIVKFGQLSNSSMNALFRSLMPCLTLSARNTIIPDVHKIRIHAHAAAVNVMKALGNVRSLSAPLSAKRKTDSFNNNELSSPNDNSTISNEEETISAIKNSSVIDLEFCDYALYTIGALQRMVMYSPDRAPIRAVIIASVNVILNYLANILESIEGKGNNADQSDKISEQISKIFGHFIRFISTLSTSNKVIYRAISVEIAAGMISTNWIWKSVHVPIRHCESSSANVQSSYAYMLVTMLKNRCNDNSPAVRMRSLTAIYDVLSSLNVDSPHEMISCLYDFAIGIAPACPNESKDDDRASSAIIDILRIRTNDDKPMVRCKAIQTFSKVFSMDWPKILQTNNHLVVTAQNSNEKTRVDLNQMLITEDDIDAIVLHCTDESVSVRKQSLVSITEILLSRPSNQNILNAWIVSVLPMTFDAESSITTKLADILYDLIFNNFYQWYDIVKYDNNYRKEDGLSQSYKSRFELISLVWRLVTSIATNNMNKLLKASIGLILKNGIIKGYKESNAKLSLMSIIEKLKFCCTFGTYDDNHDNSPHLIDGYTDPAHINSSGWILLETILSLEHINIITNSNNQTMPLQQYIKTSDSTADFVIHYYKKKYSNVSNLNISNESQLNSTSHSYDYEYLLILKVLEKLCFNLTIKNIEFFMSEISSLLLTIPHDVSLVSAMINLTKELLKSKAKYMIAHSNQFQNYFNEYNIREINNIFFTYYNEMLLWFNDICSTIYCVLYTFTSGSLPNTVNNNNISNLSIQNNLLLWIKNNRMNTISSAGNTMEIDNTLILDTSIDSRDKSLSNNSFLCSYDDNNNQNNYMIETVHSALFILGEIIMIGFNIEEDFSFADIQNKDNNKQLSINDKFILTNTTNDFGFFEKYSSIIYSKMSQQIFKIVIPVALIDLIKLCMGHQFIKLSKNSNLNDSLRSSIPSKIRATAFVALGKLCMRDKNVALEYLNVFLREINNNNYYNHNNSKNHKQIHNKLHDSEELAALRSNSLLILGDMCIRYTHLVDRHIHSISLCLMDSDEIVRKNALLLISQLILQDYLKWKGFLLCRFLLLTNDKNADIAEFSKNLLVKTMNHKFPQLLTNHFVEIMIVLNNCFQHPIFNTINLSLGTKETIPQELTINNSMGADPVPSPNNEDIIMNINRDDRFRIYNFIVEDLEDEMKIQLTAKMVQDIISYIIDNKQVLSQHQTQVQSIIPSSKPLQSAFESLLEDVLLLLMSPSFQIGRSKESLDQSDDIADEMLLDPTAENGSKASALANAKSKVLKKLSSQHLINHMLPVILSLKHTLEGIRSPLQGVLMDYIVQLNKSHKQEVDTVLQHDPILKAEIEYDLKQYEKQQQETALANKKQAMMAQKNRNKSKNNNVEQVENDENPVSSMKKSEIRRLSMDPPAVFNPIEESRNVLMSVTKSKSKIKPNLSTLRKTHFRSEQKESNQVVTSGKAGLVLSIAKMSSIHSNLGNKQSSGSGGVRDDYNDYDNSHFDRLVNNDDNHNDNVIANNDNRESVADSSIHSSSSGIQPSKRLSFKPAPVNQLDNNNDNNDGLETMAVDRVARRRSWSVVVGALDAPNQLLSSESNEDDNNDTFNKENKSISSIRSSNDTLHLNSKQFSSDRNNGTTPQKKKLRKPHNTTTATTNNDNHNNKNNNNNKEIKNYDDVDVELNKARSMEDVVHQSFDESNRSSVTDSSIRSSDSNLKIINDNNNSMLPHPLLPLPPTTEIIKNNKMMKNSNRFKTKDSLSFI
eukprot:gene4398-6220_t